MSKCLGNNLSRYSLNLSLSIMMLLGARFFAQTKNLNHEVMFAKEIRDSVREPVKDPLNFSDSYWYKFTSEKDTLLFFDIVPFDPRQDYDFELYKCVNSNCAEEIKHYKLKYIRICASVNYDKAGSTGLSPSAKKANLGPGYGDGYITPVPVKSGETYYIKVIWPNGATTQNGFKLYLYDLWPKKPQRLQSKPIVKPKEIVLENVLFETNKSTLLKESYASLDVLVNQLVSQKTMCIEIKGHTDNTGDIIKNQQLSENRAKAVFDYLISKNISKSRLSLRGLGGEEPIATNDTEEGRQKNRRVVFVVITK